MNPLEAADESVVEAMRVMAKWQDGGRVLAGSEGLFVVGRSRFPSPYSNAVFPAGPDAALPALLDAASKTFPDRRYFVWARPSLAAALGAHPMARGFLSLGDLPAMVIDAPVAPIHPGLSGGVTVSQVTDTAGFEDFVRVSQLSFAEAGLPPVVAASLFALPAEAVRSADIFVARTDGRAIAAALSITGAESRVGGVYWVGTLPEARRKGAGDAVTRAATNAAFARGATVVTLQASPAGEPVYLRMGYREVTRYFRFLSPARV